MKMRIPRRDPCSLRSRDRSSRGPSRRGIALLAMILVLTIVLLLFGLFVRQLRSERRQLDLEERKAQLAWLAQAGLERAAYRLFSEPDYKGETWTIAAEWVSSRHPADVQITVGPLPGKPGARRVTVVALEPRESATPLRSSMATRVDLPEGARSR